MRKKSRKEAWERWKRRQIAEAPPGQRKRVRELLADVPSPSAEDDRRMREAEKLVDDVFGKEG